MTSLHAGGDRAPRRRADHEPAPCYADNDPAAGEGEPPSASPDDSDRDDVGAVAALPAGGDPAPSPASQHTRSDGLRDFGESIAGCIDALRRIICRWGMEEEEANELVQEACLRALRGQSEFSRRVKPLTWVVAIAQMVRLEKLKRCVPELLDDLDGLMDREPAPAEAVGVAERRELVRQTLASLPASLCEALDLFYGHGLSLAEIALRLGTTERAAQSRLQRARAAFEARARRRGLAAFEGMPE